MIIFLITSVFASHIYPIAQNPKTFAFQLAYQQGSLTLDLNSQLTFMKLKGEEVKCNSSPFGDEIECSSCTPNCVIGDGTVISSSLVIQIYMSCNLMQSDVNLTNVLQEDQTEQMLYVSTDQEEILGLGQQRGSSKTPQNPFLSNIFHVCLGYDKGFISKEFKNPYKYQINYKSNSSSKYQVDLKLIKIQNQTIVNLTGKVTYVDSRDPYILLPEENYQKIITYFSKFQVVEESHTLIVKNQSLTLPDIEFIFDDDDEKIIMEPEAYILKLSNDTQILRFNRSKLNRTELGLPFLAQKLMTIDQNTEKFYFSDFNCQDQFQQIQLEIGYFKQILLPTLLICLVFYCILTQKAKAYKQSKANESYELTKLKQEIEDEEEI